MVDITDTQAIQCFSAYTDSLIVNHADNKKMKASVYNIQREGIIKFFEKLYQDGLKKTKGADYVYYINEIMPHRIIAPDLFRNYRNCFVFITDGYLATQNNHQQEPWTDYTPTYILEQNCKSQNFLQNLYFPITKKQDLSKVEILVLGATEYGNGQNCHFKVLECYWRSWFKNIGIKNFNSENFYLQNEAASENKIIIEQFLEIKSPLPKKDAICGSQSGAEIVYSPSKEIQSAPTTLIQKTLKPYHLFQTYTLRMREANQLYTEIMQNIEKNSYSKNLQLIGKRIVVLKELLTLTEELKNHSYCKENNLAETYATENQKIKQSLYEDEKTFKELSLFK